MVARPYLRTPRAKIIQTTQLLHRKRQDFLLALSRGVIPDDDQLSQPTGFVDRYVIGRKGRQGAGGVTRQVLIAAHSENKKFDLTH